MEQAEQALSKNPDLTNVSKFGRVAYLRLKISLSQFRGYTYPLAGLNTQYADIFGTIDAYEIYHF